MSEKKLYPNELNRLAERIVEIRKSADLIPNIAVMSQSRDRKALSNNRKEEITSICSAMWVNAHEVDTWAKKVAIRCRKAESELEPLKAQNAALKKEIKLIRTVRTKEMINYIENIESQINKMYETAGKEGFPGDPVINDSDALPTITATAKDL